MNDNKKKAQYRTFHTNFTVLSQDTSYLNRLYGGKLLHEMDVCAGITVKRMLYDSDVQRAVTAHIESVDFTEPGYEGDIIFLTGKITGLGETSIDVRVKAEKEDGKSDDKIPMCHANFVFVSIKEEEPYPHGLCL